MTPTICPSEALERHEELVVRVPAVRAVDERIPGRDEADAVIPRPVEGVVRDEVGALLEEPRVQQAVPALPAVDRAQQRLANGVAPVDGFDVEVVPFGPVDVEDDGLVAEGLGDGAGDRLQHRADVRAATDCARDLEQPLKRGSERVRGGTRVRLRVASARCECVFVMSRRSRRVPKPSPTLLREASPDRVTLVQGTDRSYAPEPLGSDAAPGRRVRRNSLTRLVRGALRALRA